MSPDVPVEGPGGDPWTVLDRMQDGFFAVDADWTITYANGRARDVLGAAMTDDTAADIEGRNLWEAVPTAVDTVFEERYREAMRTQEPVSFESRFDPLDVWFDVRAFPSASGLSIYFRDITEQKRLQQERTESLHALQRLYAISSGRDRAFEAKVQAILELGCEYLGLPNGFLTRIEDGVQTVEASVGDHPRLRVGESCPLDEAYCKRTVELDHLTTVVNAAEEGWSDDPAYDRFELDTYIGGRVQVEDALYGTLCFAAEDPHPGGFSDTRRIFVELLTRWVGYELERRRADTALERERNRLDEFASVVSHDLRNPLSVAEGHVELAAEECDTDHLDAVTRAHGRMRRLIEDLLTLAREGDRAVEAEAVPLADAAGAAWENVDTGGARLVVETDRTVRADPGRLGQLLENLFRNAVEHGSTGSRTESGDAVEHGSAVEPDDGTATLTVTVRAVEGGFVVADDGPGIPEEDRERVFETGYSTEDEGTGFGLAIVEQVADAHGWTVRATESAAGGTRFEVTGVGTADG
jgi:PAS domain S-box-containing protein